MRDFTIGDLGVFIGTIGGVVTSILIVLQKSSCLKIKCCGFECIRDPALVKKHIKEKGEPDTPKPNLESEFKMIKENNP
tara:strand:- start:834 stop:1070 length:237 start_codon:yes stop_codon:yes gene_type:complete